MSRPIVVPLRSIRRRRAQAVQKFQHLVPAALLLSAAMRAITEGVSGVGLALAIVEAVAGGAFLVSVARAVRTARRRPATGASHSHAIDWGRYLRRRRRRGGALERWRLTRHIARPTILTAVVLLVLGLFHGRILSAVERHRALRIDEAGISIGKRPFGRFRAPWASLAAIEIGQRYASIRTRSGAERRIDLRDVEDPQPVRRARARARERLAP